MFILQFMKQVMKMCQCQYSLVERINICTSFMKHEENTLFNLLYPNGFSSTECDMAKWIGIGGVHFCMPNLQLYILYNVGFYIYQSITNLNIIL